MKIKATDVCQHQWEDLCILKMKDGSRLIQQKCRKCQKGRYVDPEENNQNGSGKDENQ